MQPTPPTQPLPEHRPRTSFYVAVAAVSVIAGLLLGVGGFFGIRALQGPPSPGEEEVATEQTVPEGGEVLAEPPVGPDEAVAHDAVVPFEPTEDSGRVDVRITAVDWDATEEIRETNSLNDEPAEGSKNIMVTFEGVHRGEKPFATYGGHWVDVTYVAADGTEYKNGAQVTPLYDEISQKETAVPTDEILSQQAFVVPEEIRGEGHFVLTLRAGDVQEGIWIRAS
ncbi:hypothetical protein [Brachybacterium paraconglomeratum]|uniref:hypothetical protein n=1 Tax=Brachybacterium paraconglomeratum TaxID=173362 RepID=UPI003F7B7B17